MPQMSDKVDIILPLLMKAKQEIGHVKKDSKNPFHKSNYASLNAYIDACEEHLINNGLILLQAGNGSFSEPMIIATLLHPESGQWVKSYFPILNPKNDSQGFGSSVTYMRRYSIATLLGLVSEDDDGETAVGRGKHEQQKKKEKTSDDLSKFLEPFDKEDRHLFVEYMGVVMDHFKWSQEECLKKFSSQENIKDKFNAWKEKRGA